MDTKPLELAEISTPREHQLPTLSLIEDRTAKLLSEELSAHFKTDAQVRVDRAHTVKWQGLLDQLADGGCYNFLQLEALGGAALLIIEPNLVYQLLERLFGSSGLAMSWEPDEAKQRFSPVEERVIRRIVHQFARALEAAWRPIVPFNVVHQRIETRAMRAAPAAPEEWVIATYFALTVGDREGELALVMPRNLIEGYRRTLLSGVYEKGKNREDNWLRSLESTMRGVPVEVRAELGAAHLSLTRLLELQPGDVLRLDQSPEDPIAIHIEGQPKFLGQPTVLHGNIAILLQELFRAA